MYIDLIDVHRSDSDVDLACECDIDPYTASADMALEKWRDDLSDRLGLTAHVEIYHRETDPHVWQYVQDCSVTIYKKAS